MTSLRRSLAVGLAATAVFAGAVAYHGTAARGASGETVVDPADTPGGLDISSVTVSVGTTVAVTVRTYAPFADDQTDFRVFMDAAGSGTADYWVVVDYDSASAKPRALVGPSGSAHLTEVAIDRPDRQSVQIDVPSALIGSPGQLTWAVTSTATDANGATVQDIAPDQPGLSWSPVVPVFGFDATDTAVQSSFFPNAEADVAVVVSSDDAADAPPGAALAAIKGGPLLVTDPRDLAPEVSVELRRSLRPAAPVYLVGGESVLAPAVADAIRAAGFFPVRLSGPDRYATSLAVAEAGLGGVRTVFLAPGDGGPDAVVAAAAAGSVGGAVVLTAGSSLTADVAGFLARPGLTVYAVGAAAAADPAAVAVVGSDRYATSALVAGRFFPSPAAVGLAAGVSPADAAAAAALGEGHAPLLVVPTGGLPAQTRDYLAGHTGVTVYAFGYRVATDATLLGEVRGLI